MLNPDFRDMLCALSDAAADYLVVGAYAVAAHGAPRATGDLDLWVRASEENAPRVLAALRAFGAPLRGIKLSDLASAGTILQIGIVPRRIDILTEIDAVTFDEAWSSRKKVSIDGLQVPVIGRADLIRNKRACGRPKDLADLALLDEVAEATKRKKRSIAKKKRK